MDGQVKEAKVKALKLNRMTRGLSRMRSRSLLAVRISGGWMTRVVEEYTPEYNTCERFKEERRREFEQREREINWEFEKEWEEAMRKKC